MCRRSHIARRTQHSSTPVRVQFVPALFATIIFLSQSGILRADPPARSLPKNAMPNVLMIAIDDQNDWIGHLGGHPLAKSPHLDALAQRGTTFTNAHCQAPLCNPSRTSLLLGLRPSTTGVYGLAPFYHELPQWKDRVTLPRHFRAGGYLTASGGKIFHNGSPASEFEVAGKVGGIGVKPPMKLIPPTPGGNHPLMDWGAFPHEDSEKGDYQVAGWGIDQLKKMPRDRPFFLSLGFFLPHVPCYVTPRALAGFPDDDSILPPIREDDRNDTPRFSWYLHWDLPEPRLKWVRENNQWRNLVRSYLASTQFVDEQVGRVMEALDNQGFLENTIVIVWGDHGWHLGEKGITGKNTLWERSTRVPFIWAGPGIKPGARCVEPVELLDLYPTLIEMCGQKPVAGLEGHSLCPQLTNAATPREWPAITTHNQGNHAVRTSRWRYIRYADGSEELYDLQSDPNEWTNLIGNKSHDAIVVEHRRHLPKIDVAAVPGSKQRILVRDETTGLVTWEGKAIAPDDPIP